MAVSAISDVPAILDAIERDLDVLDSPSFEQVESLLTREVEALLVIMKSEPPRAQDDQYKRHVASYAALSAADDCVHLVMKWVNGDKNTDTVAAGLCSALPLLRRAWWAQVAESSPIDSAIDSEHRSVGRPTG